MYEYFPPDPTDMACLQGELLAKWKGDSRDREDVALLFIIIIAWHGMAWLLW